MDLCISVCHSDSMCMCVYMRVCVCVRVRACVCVYVCMYVCMYVCIHVCLCINYLTSALSNGFTIGLHKAPNRCYARVVLKVGGTALPIDEPIFTKYH